MFFDLYFFYTLFVRLLWALKFPAFSQLRAKLSLLPSFAYLVIFFSVRRLEILEHPKIFNYVYLFKFFFGRKALVTNYNSFFSLGRHYYNFNLGINYAKAATFFLPLTFLIYELQPYLNLKLTAGLNFSSGEVFTWNLWDLNIFTEKKTNVGLFDLVDPLHFRFFFRGVFSLAKARGFLDCLKITLF